MPAKDLLDTWVGTGDFADASTRVKLSFSSTGATLELRDLGLTVVSENVPVTDVKTLQVDFSVQAGLAVTCTATRRGPLLDVAFASPMGGGSVTLGRSNRAVASYDAACVNSAGDPVTTFRLRTPVAEDDGWSVATPASAGVDPAPLRELGRAIAAGTFPAVDNVVLAVGGRIVFESYFYGRASKDLHTIQSCSKSVTALAVGIAVDRGFIKNLDDQVSDYFPKRADTRWIDTPYDATIADLLAMRVGLDWNETLPYTDPGNNNTLMNVSEDWLGYVLDRPRRADWPADRFEYQSGLTILLGAVLAEATGMSVVDFAREHLFAPLGIRDFRWFGSPAGVTHTGGGLHLRPRDLLKIGDLIRTGGTWNGTQVVSSDWIDTLSTAHARNDDVTYGYQWWLSRTKDMPHDPPRVAALGYGGQSLHVFPTLDAQVVTNATDFADGSGHFTMVNDYVLPALRG